MTHPSDNCKPGAVLPSLVQYSEEKVIGKTIRKKEGVRDMENDTSLRAENPMRKYQVLSGSAL